MMTIKNIPSECIKYRNREKTLMFSEKGRFYYGLNPDPKEILGFKVDKRLINNDENGRCDYSLILSKRHLLFDRIKRVRRVSCGGTDYVYSESF